MQMDWPLVGRTGELGQLVALIRGVYAGGAVLVGPGGVGKTRLATECLAVAQSDGLATATAVATRASSKITLGALAPLLPPLGDRTINLLVTARNALHERAGDRRLVLFVDDAHLLDDASASLVLQLVANREVFVLATVRSGEDVSDAITELWKDEHAARLDVRPLPESEVDQLIAESLGADVEPGTHDELRRISRGNPLALRELIMAAVESGSLAQHDGRWGLAGPFRISDRIADLVEERLGSLDAAESEATEFVALGEPVSIDILERLTRPEAVESIERKGIIAVRETDGRLEAWLDHPLFGEVLRANVGALRTRNVLRSLADALEQSSPTRPGDLLRLATWRLESGSPAGPELLLQAARQAMAVNDIELASRICEAAWSNEQTVAIGVLLARALCDLGRFADAELVVARTAELVESDDDRVSITSIRAELLFRTGAAAEALALEIDAIEELDDPTAKALLVAHRATFLMLMGEATEAHALANAILDDDALEPISGAAIVSGTVLTWDGRPGDAIVVHERAYERCVAALETESFTLQDDASIQLVGIIQAFTQAGRLAEADEMLALAWREVADRRSTIPMAWISLQTAIHRVAVGQIGDALRWGRMSVELWSSSGLYGRMRWPQGVVAQSLAMLGRDGEAQEQMAWLDTIDTPIRFNEAGVMEARAWVLSAFGALEDARKLLVEAGSLGITMGQRTCALSALHALARLGAPELAVGPMEALRGDVQGPLLLARIDHVSALCELEGDRLLAVANDFEDMGSLLLAAEAAADAARAFRRASRSRDATAASARSRHLAARCEGARTPALLLTETAAPLTRREREVAVLASKGMSSKEIAERLYLSVRTVDNHLSRAYEKLGVTGRDGLASVADQLVP